MKEKELSLFTQILPLKMTKRKKRFVLLEGDIHGSNFKKMSENTYNLSSVKDTLQRYMGAFDEKTLFG